MKTIEHITEIDAPAEAVWQALTDVGSYREWNPFLTIDRAPAAVGERLDITVRAGKRSMRFRPTVTAYEPGRRIEWLGRFIVPRLFDGTHTLAVEALPDGRSRFVHREIFRGVLVPLGGRMLRDTDAGFAAMNEALRRRVEGRVAA